MGADHDHVGSGRASRPGDLLVRDAIAQHRVGADAGLPGLRDEAGEPVADVTVRGPERLRAFDVPPEWIPRMVDEVPAWAVAASTAAGISRVRGAAELRVKESDRIASLGRNLATGAAGTAVVPLIQPGTLYDERLYQLDFRASKVFRVGASRRLQANIDLYNAGNSSAILGINTTYGANWMRPTSILQGRLLKFGAQFDF